MNRRSAIKTLGALFATGVVSVAVKKVKEKPINYIDFLNSTIRQVENGQKVDIWALREILEKMEPGVAWYYCREFYLHSQTRPMIDGSRKLLENIAKYRGMKITYT